MSNLQRWQTIIPSSQTDIPGREIVSFGDPESEYNQANTANCVSPLCQPGVIEVSGDEAMSFLQNQLSNDLNQVDNSHSQLAAYCTAKGRVFSLFRVLRGESGYLLILPEERIEATLKRLRMFVLMSHVTLTDVSSAYLHIGLWGYGASQLLENMGLSGPEADNRVTQGNGLIVCRVPGLIPRFHLLVPTHQASAVWTTLATTAQPVGEPVWRNQDLLSGLPQIVNATSEAFVPQMINLHSLHGISFTKGCYPGQEVVARMHYLGTLKRRMYLAEVGGMLGEVVSEAVCEGMAPLPGDEVFQAGSNGQAVGKVVASAPVLQNRWNLLLVLQISSAGEGPLWLANHPERAITLKDLPYSVEVERS